jgi:hypothetical protein
VAALASMSNELPPEGATFRARDAIRVAVLVAGSLALIIVGLIGAWVGRRRRTL